ncbi:hypothetical protein CD934_21880 [Streptomyces calvus]|uniref:Uncharacterized protein n=1 Tax=Streptomyces calvus TaxID=67282 RepID=A0A514JUK0_9ACTN|nr:hypothetical protein [Streptomyces calvus]QDI71040.1 hypothetical protein CD934_21880 [Streptomyces calvus]
MRAFSDANSLLAKGQRELGAACAAVVKSAHDVDRGIGALDRFQRIGGALPAPGTSDTPSHSTPLVNAVPPHRPRPARLWKWLVWPVSLLAAFFDSVFVASTIHEVLGLSEDEQVQYWLAYLPGVGITVCLLAVGSFLAERLAAEAVPGRRRRLVEPWACVIGLLLLVMLCGAVRILIAADSDAYLVVYAPVILVLLLLLGIAAIVTKVRSYDPAGIAEAEERRASRKAVEGGRKHAKAVGRGLAERMKAADDLSDRTRKALTAHVTEWFALKTTFDTMEQAARRHVEDAATGLVEERTRTGLAGAFDFPLATTDWPDEPGLREARGQYPERRREGPGIEWDLLSEAEHVLDLYHPDGFADRLRRVLGELDRQWSAHGPAEDAVIAEVEEPGAEEEKGGEKERTG